MADSWDLGAMMPPSERFHVVLELCCTATSRSSSSSASSSSSVDNIVAGDASGVESMLAALVAVQRNNDFSKKRNEIVRDQW